MMKHKTDIQTRNTTDTMRMIHQLAVEMVIEAALKNQRKQELKQLIDEALCNKNEANFKMYTKEFLQLEEHEIETLG